MCIRDSLRGNHNTLENDSNEARNEG